MDSGIYLEGGRLIVRDWRLDEIDGMHRWYGDPEVRRFVSFGADSKEESEKHLKETVVPSQSEDPRIEYYLAVELKETGQTIGDVGFEWKEPGHAEIGYFFEPSYWGAGYATEAAKLVIQYAFDLGADSVFATCDEKNTASEKVMQRCGLQPQPSNEVGRLLYRVERSRFVE